MNLLSGIGRLLDQHVVLYLSAGHRFAWQEHERRRTVFKSTGKLGSVNGEVLVDFDRKYPSTNSNQANLSRAFYILRSTSKTSHYCGLPIHEQAARVLAAGLAPFLPVAPQPA